MEFKKEQEKKLIKIIQGLALEYDITIEEAKKKFIELVYDCNMLFVRR